MKKSKKVPKVQEVTGQTDCFVNHDFVQVGEQHIPSAYGSSLGQLGAALTIKPRFICRKCGKVIQL